MSSPTPTTLSPDDSRAQEAFALWQSVGKNSPATRTSLGDWQLQIYRDALCFNRPGEREVYMVSSTAILHFGLDTDSYESAYDALHRTSYRNLRGGDKQVRAALRRLRTGT